MPTDEPPTHLPTHLPTTPTPVPTDAPPTQLPTHLPSYSPNYVVSPHLPTLRNIISSRSYSDSLSLSPLFFSLSTTAGGRLPHPRSPDGPPKPDAHRGTHGALLSGHDHCCRIGDCWCGGCRRGWLCYFQLCDCCFCRGGGGGWYGRRSRLCSDGRDGRYGRIGRIGRYNGRIERHHSQPARVRCHVRACRRYDAAPRPRLNPSYTPVRTPPTATILLSDKIFAFFVCVSFSCVWSMRHGLVLS